jgi:hypothetical protein
MICSLPFVTITPLGFEIIGNIQNTDVLLYMSLKLRISGTIYEYYLGFDRNNEELYIYKPGWVKEVIASSFKINEGANKWFSMKLTVDPDIGTYNRARFNNQEFDISSFSPPSSASALPDEFFVYISGRATGAAVRKIYLAACIVTQNER